MKRIRFCTFNDIHQLIVGGEKKFDTEFLEKYPAGVRRELLMGFRMFLEKDSNSFLRLKAETGTDIYLILT
jgi:hypothetical protein